MIKRIVAASVSVGGFVILWTMNSHL